MQQFTTENIINKVKFINKANIIHRNKYDYSNVVYINSKIPIEITCPKHGAFFQVPKDHSKGYGCNKCSNKNKPSTEEWVNEAKKVHGDLYDYSLVKYVTNKTPVKIICTKHGIFNPLPGNHLFKKTGCPKCNSINKSLKYSKTTEEFVKDAILLHGDTYDYSKSIYKNKITPLEIVCKRHGSFLQSPSSHLSGSGCSKCKLKSQTKVFNTLVSKFLDLEIIWEAKLPWLEGQRFDIFIPCLNLAIEYNGEQHYTSINHMGGIDKLHLTQQSDILKKEKCLKNNCELHELKYDYTKEDMNDLISRIRFLLQRQI